MVPHLFLLATLLLGPAQNANEKEIGLAAEGYLANREAFPFFRCRLEALEGRAESVEAAVKAKYLEKSPVSAGVWVADGEKTYFRLNCDPSFFDAALAKARDENAQTVPQPCIEDHFLSDGRLKVRASFNVKVANFYNPEQDFPVTYNTPWRTGESSVGDLLKDCLRGKKWGRFDGYDDTFGKGLMAFSVGYTSAKDICRRFVLDPERGFLPVCYWLITDDRKPYTQEIITHFKQCSNKRWFPERLVVVYQPEEKPPYLVREYKVTALDADERPTENDFEMDFSDVTQVCNLADPRTAYKPAPGEKVNVNQLEALGAKLKWVAEHRDDLRTPASRPFQWRLFAVINLLFLCLVLGMVAYRRWRGAKTVSKPG